MAEDKAGKLEDHVQSRETWLRFFYMLVLGCCFGIAEAVATAVVLFQFFCVLFSGERNANLLRFGGNLSLYLYQVARYMTYSSDNRPFPFAPWPEEGLVSDFSESTDEE